MSCGMHHVNQHYDRVDQHYDCVLKHHFDYDPDHPLHAFVCICVLVAAYIKHAAVSKTQQETRA